MTERVGGRVGSQVTVVSATWVVVLLTVAVDGRQRCPYPQTVVVTYTTFVDVNGFGFSQ